MLGLLPPLAVAGYCELRVTKSNYGVFPQPLLLTRDRERHGALRPASVVERDDVIARRARRGRDEPSETDKLATCARAAVAVLRCAARPMSGSELESAIDVKVRTRTKLGGINRAIGLGAIRVSGGERPGVARWHTYVGELPAEHVEDGVGGAR